jgi:hypothetical protein
MRQLLAIITIILGMTFLPSCSNKPDDVIHNIKSEFAGWVVDKTVSDKPIQKFEDYYQISPTWEQANYYASKRPDHGLYLTLGFVLLLGFSVVFYGRTTNASWLPKSLDNPLGGNIVLFILLVSSISFLTAHQSGVKWNNDKWVKKEVYDKAVKETGSTQPIWDSLEVNKLIVDGPY